MLLFLPKAEAVFLVTRDFYLPILSDVSVEKYSMLTSLDLIAFVDWLLS